MRIKILFTAIAFTAFLSCKQHQPAAAGQENTKAEVEVKSNQPVAETSINSSQEATEPVKIEDSKVAKGDQTGNAADSTVAFVVSFYSAGAGIDRGMPEKLKAYVDIFGKKINKQVAYDESHWGREGEVDYCFGLKGLTDVQIVEFKKGVKDVLKEAPQVNYLENQPCHKHR